MDSVGSATLGISSLTSMIRIVTVIGLDVFVPSFTYKVTVLFTPEGSWSVFSKYNDCKYLTKAPILLSPLGSGVISSSVRMSPDIE